jgi:pyruvate kinase
VYNVVAMGKTKIIATVGPACDSPECLTGLIKAGVNLFRFNMSHEGTKDLVKEAGILRKLNSNVGIIADLQGPRIRTGRLKNKTIELKKGRELILTTKQVNGDEIYVSIDYKGLPGKVKTGDRLLLDNGLIELHITKVTESDIHCKVLTGGILGQHKGINVPGVSVFKKALTEKDKADILSAIKAEVDYLALSFIKSPDDILETKKFLQDNGAKIPVIAKIENPEALPKIDAIIQVADAIMVARGDLGVELPPEDVPIIQKALIKKCAKAGKPVIVASQMLESMVESPRPTRAETTDVANAIIDGADAVMLSEETASGKFPIEAATMMRKIIEKVESQEELHNNLDETDIKNNISFAVSHAASHMCEDLNAKAIITFTSSGSTALMVSKWRRQSPIIAAVTSQKTVRRISLYWGVQAIKIKEIESTDKMISSTEQATVEQKLLKKGDLVVITAGVPIGVPGTTNLIKVHTIG